MSSHDAPRPDPGPEDPGAWDDALCRLEDVLLATPYDRALPDLEALLDRAGVSRAYVRQDERALKLLGEAMLARPLGHAEDVRRSRTHVEMMALEVEVLIHRLRDTDTDVGVARRAQDRLAELAEQVARLRDEL